MTFPSPEMDMVRLCQRIAAQGDENQARLAKAEAYQAALDRRLDRLANKAADLRAVQRRFDAEGETILAVTQHEPTAPVPEGVTNARWRAAWVKSATFIRDTDPVSLMVWAFGVGCVAGTALTQNGYFL